MPATKSQQLNAATQGFSGGVNLRDALNQLAANEARRMENGILDERGGFSKRLGVTSMGLFNNLIANDGFEIDLSGWTNWNGGAAISRAVGQSYLGIAAMQVVTDNTVSGALKSMVAGQLTAGVTYQVSVAIKRTVGNGNLTIQVNTYTAGAVLLTSPSLVINPTNAYTVYTFNFVAPATATQFEFYVYNSSGVAQTYFVDNVQVSDTTQKIISQYVFYRGLNAPHILIQTSEGKLLFTSDPTASPIVWTQITTGLSTTAPLSFETFNSLCFFSNGVDAYASWDGATYVTYGSAPRGKYLRLYKDTMWMSGITGLQDRVYSSSPGDATTWPVSSWVDIAKGDGDSVTALATDGNFLIVGKLRRYMTIYDPVTFANKVVDYEKGIESHFSVVQFEAEIYFLSRRGIVKYITDSPGTFISLNLDPLFDSSVLNLAALSGVTSYTVGNRIGWCLPETGGTINTLQIEYYPRLGALSPYGFRQIGPFCFSRMPIQNAVRWRFGSNERLLCGSNSANKMYWAYSPIGTDDGATFAAILETPAFDFGAPTRTKYLRQLRVLGRGRFVVQLKPDYKTSIKKSFSVDLTSTSNVWNSGNWNVGTWGPDSLFKEKRVNADMYARAFSIVFTDSEITTGRKLVEVGSKEYSLQEGEWGLYGCWLEGALLGVRDE